MKAWETEEQRRAAFPVTQHGIFLAHAGVSPLPAVAAQAIVDYARKASERQQEFAEVFKLVMQTREASARAIGARASEIALLGPTSLGLSLFANGLEWKEGDEVICYPDDYPSNVYPWTNLRRFGVRVRPIHPRVPGRIGVEEVRDALSAHTQMVALASCHYLTGWRLDVAAVGETLHRRGILFALDAIQTVGAFPTEVSGVDFLSADSHKWMLGPMAAGIVYVAERNFERCRPSLLGAWNVKSPDFLASQEIEFEATARRYEPGVLNIAGIAGMKASLELLEATGAAAVQANILALRDELEERLAALGFDFLSPRQAEPWRSGILTARHPHADSQQLFQALEKEKITSSLRRSRDGQWWLRFSPHFYNTSCEIQEVVAVLDRALRSGKC